MNTKTPDKMIQDNAIREYRYMLGCAGVKIFQKKIYNTVMATKGKQKTRKYESDNEQKIT